MNLTLWIFQAVLAAVFGFSGLAKSTMSRKRLLATGQTGIGRALTPLAAVGLCVVMVGAASSHARLREPWAVAANALLFALALTVAIGRFAGLA